MSMFMFPDRQEVGPCASPELFPIINVCVCVRALTGPR